MTNIRVITADDKVLEIEMVCTYPCTQTDAQLEALAQATENTLYIEYTWAGKTYYYFPRQEAS